MRAVSLTALSGALLIALGIPALATQSYCNSDDDACATLTGQSISGGAAHDTAKSFTIDDKNKRGLEVKENYETDHVYGWTTDASKVSGSSSDNASSETGALSFTCSGGTYEFYSSHWVDVGSSKSQTQFEDLHTSVFSCG